MMREKIKNIPGSLKQGFQALPFLLLIVSLSACSLFGSAGSHDAEKAAEIRDGGIQDDIDDGGSGNINDPTTGGTEADPNASEECSTSEDIRIVASGNPISFGQNQRVDIEDVDTILECQTVRVTGCIPFSAEIIYPEGSNSIYVDDNQNYKQFILRNQGTISEARVSGAKNEIEVCYRRLASPEQFDNVQSLSHSATLQVVAEQGGRVYAERFAIAGQTLPKLLKITEPLANELIWDGPPRNLRSEVGQPTSSRSYVHWYNIDMKGCIQYDNLLLPANQDASREVRVSVRTGGRNFKAKLDDNNCFTFTGDNQEQNENTGPAIEIPYRPAQVYSVTACIKTIKGDICQSIPLIRHTIADGVASIIDATGQDVSAINEDPSKPSGVDERNLQLKINIRNLDVAGPEDHQGNAHPVRLTAKVVDNTHNEAVANQAPEQPQLDDLREMTDCPQNPERVNCDDGNCLFEEVPIDINQANAEAEELLSCGNAVSNRETSYCHDIDLSKDFKKGVNRVVVQACNDYTDHKCGRRCVSFDKTIIVASGKPTISCTPYDNSHFGQNEDISLSCTIENYKAPTEDTNECFVKVWLNEKNFNENEENSGYEVCPQVLQGQERSEDSGNRDNIRKGTFTIRLADANADNQGNNIRNVGRVQRFDSDSETRNAVNQIPGLTLYTNLINIRVQDANGHFSYRTFAYQRGELKRSTFRSNIVDNVVRSKTLVTSKLGDFNQATGKTERAPLMLNISEGTLVDRNIKMVVEKLLNEELKFSDLIQGGKLPGDEDGDSIQDPDETINLDAPFIRDHIDFFSNPVLNEDPENPLKKEIIWRNLHGNMPQKFRALLQYRNYALQTNRVNPRDLENLRFSNECRDDVDVTDPSNFNVACDSCGNKIPTSLVSYRHYKHIYKNITSPENLCDKGEWPKYAVNRDGSCNPDFDDTVQGKWKIGNINLKANGVIDAEICLMGEGEWVDHRNTPNNPCDDQPARFDSTQPAYWASNVAQPLILRGITSLENDPLLPVIWNLGKLRILAKDLLQIHKVQVNGKTTNRVTLHKDQIRLGTRNPNATFQMEPYLNCANFWNEHYGDDLRRRFGDNFIPYGCNTFPDNTVYPVLVNQAAPYGQRTFINHGGLDGDNWIVDVLWERLQETIGEIFTCMVEEQINPLLNKVAFPYPPWVAEEDKDDFSEVAIEDSDGIEIAIPASDADNPIFKVKAYLNEADISTDDNQMQVKVPVHFEANSVSRNARMNGSGRGYLRRETVANDIDQILPLDGITESPYFSLSISEEMIHALFHTIFQDGPFKRINLISEDLKNDLELNTPWSNSYTMGFDSRVAHNLDICETIGGLLAPDLPLQTIAVTLEPLKHEKNNEGFSHLRIKLNRNYPPTIGLRPVDTSLISNPQRRAQIQNQIRNEKNIALLDIGATNIEIGIHDYYKYDDTREVYNVSAHPLARLRLDAKLIIGLKAKHVAEHEMIRLEAFLQPESVIYLSVIDGNGTIDDQSVFQTLKKLVLELAMNKLFKDININLADGEDAELPSFAINLPLDISKLTEDFVYIKNSSPDANELPLPPFFIDDDGEEYRILGGAGNRRPLRHLVLQDYTSLDKNGSCDGIEKPRYSFRERFEPPIIENAIDAVIDAAEDLNRHAVSLDEDEIEEMVNGVQCLGVGMGVPRNQNDCTCLFEESYEIDICEMGIDSVLFEEDQPLQIQFDTQSGYINVDGGLILQVYDWLEDEVSIDE